MSLTPEEYETEKEKCRQTNERYELIMAAQRYSEQEAHEISALLCFLRDCDDPVLSARV